MINKFQFSVIFLVYLIHLVLRVASVPISDSISESGNEKKSDLDAQPEACIVESGVNPYKFNQQTYEKLIDNTDHKLGCFMACAMKAAGTMNQDGTFNKDKIKEESPKEELESVQKCLGEKGADECETAIKFVKCTSK